ncbi:hypothetical protein D3C76_1237940 [compost metagenome]
MAAPAHLGLTHLPQIVATEQGQDIDHVTLVAIEGHRKHQIIIQLLGVDATGNVAMADETSRHFTIVVDPTLLAAIRLTDLLVELLHRRRGQAAEQDLCAGMSRRHRHQN